MLSIRSRPQQMNPSNRPPDRIYPAPAQLSRLPGGGAHDEQRAGGDAAGAGAAGGTGQEGVDRGAGPAGAPCAAQQQ